MAYRSPLRNRAFRALGPTLAALALAGSAGCGQDKGGGANPTEQAQEELSAGQIANIAMLVNHAEIAQIEVAKPRLKDPLVVEFAQRIVEGHTQAQNKLQAVIDKLKLKPEESDIGNDLRRMGDSMTQQLRHASSVDYDLTFTDTQLYMHRRALTVLDRQLLPQSEDEAELHAALEEMRATVNLHHNDAMRLRKKWPPPENIPEGRRNR